MKNMRSLTRKFAPASTETIVTNTNNEIARSVGNFDTVVETARQIIRNAGTAEADHIRSVAETLAAEIESRADRLASSI